MKSHCILASNINAWNDIFVNLLAQSNTNHPPFIYSMIPSKNKYFVRCLQFIIYFSRFYKLFNQSIWNWSGLKGFYSMYTTSRRQLFLCDWQCQYVEYVVSALLSKDNWKIVPNLNQKFDTTVFIHNLFSLSHYTYINLMWL